MRWTDLIKHLLPGNEHKSEESPRRKSLPVLYTTFVGPSRLRILSPLIHKEEQWFESLHERRTEVRNCDPIPFDGFQKVLRIIIITIIIY